MSSTLLTFPQNTGGELQSVSEKRAEETRFQTFLPVQLLFVALVLHANAGLLVACTIIYLQAIADVRVDMNA